MQHIEISFVHKKLNELKDKFCLYQNYIETYTEHQI